MITGVEVNFVVSDCLAALSLYERIFEVQRFDVTNLPKGQNEAVFTIYGTRFHMLDENKEFQLVPPAQNVPRSVWFNIVVPDLRTIHYNAVGAGCAEIQPITDLPNYGVTNSVLGDPFGYLWMLHQVHR